MPLRTKPPPISTSPFLSPGRGPDRVPRRRKRRKLAAIGALGLAILAAVAGAVALASRSKGRTHHAPRAAHRTVARAAPARSPSGLLLGKPHFALAGLAAPRHEPVQIAFHRPPRAGLLFNLSSGRVLWQRNASRRLAIASLTKMMTALLTVKAAPAGAPVLVTREAVAADGSKVGVLPVRRHVRLESLLYGLLLPSGNDAAVALAEHVAGSVTRFVRRMNVEAARLGMGCTHYTSPHGYYDQGNFSCAADLAVLAHYDLAQPRIARVTDTYHAVLPFPIKGGKLYLANNNPMLIYGYPGTTGLKTGYTIASGRCLVATAERHGVRLGVVLLHSADPATQAKKLLDRAFERIYGQRPVHEPPIPPSA
jgi:serine-type D-Ala-D-Ala carboxypeptidase (penicillin-binding protein 5/6)